MIGLIKVKLQQFVNIIRSTGKLKYILLGWLGLAIAFFIGFFFIKVFGFLYSQAEFPLVFKLFLSEKILMMVFLTLFLMLVLSALISTLNIFFLSRDLNLLFASPLKAGTIFLWKAIETAFSSASMVLFFSLPVLYAYCFYFAPEWGDILGVALVFFLYVGCGVLSGILLGLIIPSFFSVKKMQPVLSLVSIALVSCIVVFLRLLRPERFLNPDSIDNLIDFMSGLDIGFFSYFPFSWMSRAMNHISTGNPRAYWMAVILFSVTFLLLSGAVWIFQKKFYMKLFDRLNQSSGGVFHSTWKSSVFRGNFGTLWKKEFKTFVRTPSQWSQLLIIGAMVMVFILNMKSIPLPHPAIKNVIVYLNLGMAAFIVAGLNSRFTFTALPMEGKGIGHVLASPFDRRKFLRFKLVFYGIPQILIGFILFFSGDLAFKLDPFFRLAALFFLLPGLILLSVMALFFGLQIKDFSAVTPQHLIVSKPGISYMLWSLFAIVLGMIYFIRPLFLYYFNQYKMKPPPYTEIFVWFFGFVVINYLLSRFFYRWSQKIWLKREFY